MATLETDTDQNSSAKHSCECCHYSTSRHSQFMRHKSTGKHLKNENGIQKTALVPAVFKCTLCDKNYKDRSGLWKHSKKCQKSNPINKQGLYNKDEPSLVEMLIKENTDFKNLILELVKSNSDLQKQMLDVCKNSSSNSSNSSNGNSNSNNNINSNNKTFNMQVFLNEQCKDAMNIMDFVNTFQLEYSDLEKVGEVGYVEGISNIIITKLNEMDIYKRPIHCSDEKRETMFVRDKNVWEKENNTHDKLRLAIRHITKKNTDMLLSWCEAHPGSCDSDNYLNDIYIEMVRQAMGGRDIEANENKIMRKISKVVLVNKKNM